VPLGIKRQKIRAKFDDLCTPVIGRNRADTIRKAILELENLPTLGALFP
jgi:hypothetical protein